MIETRETASATCDLCGVGPVELAAGGQSAGKRLDGRPVLHVGYSLESRARAKGFRQFVLEHDDVVEYGSWGGWACDACARKIREVIRSCLPEEKK